MKQILFQALAFLFCAFAHAEQFLPTVGDGPTKLPALNSGDTLFIRLAVDRSYCCTIRSMSSSLAFNNVDISSMGIDKTVVAERGLTEPVVRLFAGARQCFYYEDDSREIDSASLSLSFFLGTPVTDAYVDCAETTLLGGFNTSVTDFNFVEITNTLKDTGLNDGVVKGKLIARDAISNSVILERELELSPESRLDINIHDVAGPGRFGYITIHHDAPLGAIHATTSQYRIVSTSPLDFEPVAQQAFVLRSGK